MKEGDIVLHDGRLKEVDWLRTNTLVVKDLRKGDCMVTTPDRVTLYGGGDDNVRRL